MLHDVLKAGGTMADDNYELLPPYLAQRIQSDPEYLEYISGVAVAMYKKASEITRQLDEATYTSNEQPLTLYVRRLRENEEVVIRWSIADFPGLEHLRVVGMRYQKHVPLTTGAGTLDNPSHPIVGRSDQRIGSVEINLKPGQSAYCGFWLEGRQLVRSGVFSPPVYGDWRAKNPISFTVYMPEQTGSQNLVTEQFTKVDLDARIIRQLGHMTEQMSGRAVVLHRDGAGEVQIEERKMKLLQINRCFRTKH
jgi:hypothetical protein